MAHSTILMMVLALALGVVSIAVSVRNLAIYKLDFIKYLIVFLIALNTAAVIGIFFNYYAENLRDAFSQDVYRMVDTSYRLAANLIIPVIGGSLVLMLRALVNDSPSTRYLVGLATLWGLILAVFVVGIWVPLERGPAPLTILANIALDQLVQYLVLFECARSWIRSSVIGNAERRTWTRRFLGLFGIIWVCLIAVAFLMIAGEAGNRFYNLLSAILYVILNAAPLTFLGLFLRHAYHQSAQTSTSFSENLVTYCDQYGASRREKEIIRLLCRGYPNKRIADELFISLSTVKDHNHNIFRKFKVSSRAELVALLNNAENS